MNIKPIHTLIILGVLAIIIAFLFVKMNNMQNEIIILKKKYENIQKSIDNTDAVISDKKKKSPKIKLSSSSSSTSSSSSEQNPILKNLGIPNLSKLPNIFSMFNMNKADLMKEQNIESLTSHPEFQSLESETEDISSVTENVKEVIELKPIQEIKKEETNLEKVFINNEDLDKTEIDNDEHIQTYSNSENKEEKQIEQTVEQPTEQTIEKEPMSEKDTLEKLKVVELKELAKKKNINIMNGKKAKNKTELINDLLSIK